MKSFIDIHRYLIEDIASFMRKTHQTLSIAESCTGGFLSSCFTSFPGASQYFSGSIISYSNQSKDLFLGVKQQYIDQYGAGSREVARMMVQNVRDKYKTEWGLSTTGYVDATHDISSPYAWIAVSNKDYINTRCVYLDQNRIKNIQVISLSALELLKKEIR